MKNYRYIFSIAWIIIGIILIGLSFAEVVDSFWSGMGSALFVVGILQILRFHRFNKNASYREKIEIAENDERNHFLRNKTWAWTGYVFVLSSAISSIIFRIIGQDSLSSFLSGAICYMLVIYWIVYTILKRKY